VGELLQKNQNNFSNDPSKQSYEASLHAAKLSSAREESKKSEQTNISGRYAAPSGDDYEINRASTSTTEESGAEDEQSDFEAGYNSAAGDGSFLKEKLVSWAAGIFSPPGTGPMFGSGASLIQWIFREETSATETTIENEET
jgi:hypothetical protein